MGFFCFQKARESELVQESAQLQLETDARKKENSAYRNMEKEYQQVRSKVSILSKSLV